MRRVPLVLIVVPYASIHAGQTLGQHLSQDQTEICDETSAERKKKYRDARSYARRNILEPSALSISYPACVYAHRINVSAISVSVRCNGMW